MTDYETHCGCNELAHYNDPLVGSLVDADIRRLGPCLRVTVAGLGTFMVPRHYIALHGIKGADVPALARLYGWQQV